MVFPQLRCIPIQLLSLSVCLLGQAQDKKDEPKKEVKKGPGYEWLDLPGNNTSGPPKHLVFLTGDEEHRSEEALPMLAKLMAEQHGFHCTVLFCMDNGTIDPNNPTNIPNFAAVKSADIIVMAWRFREPQDSDTEMLLQQIHNGTPIIALRDSIRAFGFDNNPRSKHAKLDWQTTRSGWEGGFGAKYLGSTWHGHWAAPATTITQFLCEAAAHGHPVLQDVKPAKLATNIAKVRPAAEATILLRGEVVGGPDSNANPVPSMPIAWAMESPAKDGKIRRSITCTAGSAVDFQEENLRRFFVNSVYWCLATPPPPDLAVTPTGTYAPSPSGFMKFKEKQNAATIWKSLQPATAQPETAPE